MIKVLENYSNKAVQIIDEAKRIADEYNSKIVGSEHLLLALYEAKDSICSFLLSERFISKEDIMKEIEDLIEYTRSVNPDITHLEPKHAPLIAQIISNYNLKEVPPGTIPEAQMIFLGAPTGAGKDTLLRKIELDNKNFNMQNILG